MFSRPEVEFKHSNLINPSKSVLYSEDRMVVVGFKNDSHPFHQYQQTEQSLLIFTEHKKKP
jgi:hypothetical protein